MADETRKIVLEREYVVPLRRGWIKVPEYGRVKKAVKTLKEFMVRNMKIYDRDLRKVRVNILLNNELMFRGIRHPPAKIRVKAVKYDDGTVEVKLVNLPKHIEFEVAREARMKLESMKNSEKKEKADEAPKEEKKEQKEDVKEKEQSSKEAEMKLEKQKAKEAKHTTQPHQKEQAIQRKALKK